jgi:methylphosphotriester-DNA--protein-cysteine methyltransferase
MSSLAVKLDMHRNAISNIRTRFMDVRLACVEDAPRLGKSPIHLAQTKEKVVTTVCRRTSQRDESVEHPGACENLKLSKSYVHGVLKEHDLHTHRLITLPRQQNLCGQGGSGSLPRL